MDFAKGEDVEWTIADKGNLSLSLKKAPPHTGVVGRLAQRCRAA
jgi:hypothetical protein